MSKRRIKPFHLVILTASIIFNPLSVYCRDDAHRTDSRVQSSIRVIPFSVTAGVPVGEASIGIIESVIEVEGFPLNIPAVFFPPSEDSFITQNITLPPNLSLNRPLFIEILFTGDIGPPPAAQATARLSLAFFASFTEPVGPVSGIGGGQQQSVEVTSGLKKVTFGIPITPIIAQADVLTIQIGRPGKENSEDTYPGIVRIQAVRIGYVPQ